MKTGLFCQSVPKTHMLDDDSEFLLFLRLGRKHPDGRTVCWKHFGHHPVNATLSSLLSSANLNQYLNLVLQLDDQTRTEGTDTSLLTAIQHSSPGRGYKCDKVVARAVSVVTWMQSCTWWKQEFVWYLSDCEFALMVNFGFSVFEKHKMYFVLNRN